MAPDNTQSADNIQITWTADEHLIKGSERMFPVWSVTSMKKIPELKTRLIQVQYPVLYSGQLTDSCVM